MGELKPFGTLPERWQPKGANEHTVTVEIRLGVGERETKSAIASVPLVALRTRDDFIALLIDMVNCKRDWR